MEQQPLLDPHYLMLQSRDEKGNVKYFGLFSSRRLPPIQKICAFDSADECVAWLTSEKFRSPITFTIETPSGDAFEVLLNEIRVMHMADSDSDESKDAVHPAAFVPRP